MSHELQQVPLKGGRSLLASYSRAKTRSKSWLVFLPESGSDFRSGARGELDSLVGARIAKKYNFLVINKPGVALERTNRAEFESSFRRARRIDDALRALEIIVPKGHRIDLVGYSEGAYLAPQIARRESRVRTVSMIGGGTRGWLKEELSTASPRERVEYEKRIAEINRNPTERLRWNGFSYATWHSYRGDNTLRALRGLQLPTLAILGARDRVIDLKTTIVDLMLVSENQPIQLHVFGECGHDFTKHWLHVSRVLGRFLSDQVGLQ